MQKHIAKDCDAYQDGQWLLVDINMDKFDGRAERINVTLSHRLLTRINSIVKQSGEYSSRSAFLATAARNELQKTG